MVCYKLVYQKVDVTLDFDNYTLKGSTHLKLRKVKETHLEYVDNVEKFMLPINLPIIGNPVYKRVLLDDSDVQSFFLKSVSNNKNPKVLEESIKNVDLMTYEGLHHSVQSLNDSMMYVEVDPNKSEFNLDIVFDYYDMTAMNSEVYFEKHWILPRGSTNYREYKLFVSAKYSQTWFPTFFGSYSKCLKYEFNITVPVDYNVICGFPLRENSNERQVNQHMTTKTLRFVSFNPNEFERNLNNHGNLEGTNYLDIKNEPLNGENSEDIHDSHLLYETFGLFVGEFDFCDGLRVDKKDEIVEEAESDEEFAQLSNDTFEFKKNSKLSYVTLKGLGYLLHPTNVATTFCLETYKSFLDMELCGLYLLFLPLGSFPENMDLSSCLRSQNYVDFKRCSGFTACENYLFSCFMDPLTQMHYDMYYKSGGNILVYSLDVLHSFTDLTHDPKCIDKRIVIATGLSSLYVKKVQNPSKDLHLNLMLQSYLVDQFIKRNLGNSEHKLRLWARRELFATLVELVGDFYPLTTKQTQNDTSNEVGFDKKEGFISEQLLMSDTVFLLKCQLIPSVLESIFLNTYFLNETFILNLFKRYLNLNKEMNKVNWVNTNYDNINSGKNTNNNGNVKEEKEQRNKTYNNKDKNTHRQMGNNFNTNVDGNLESDSDSSIWECLLNEVVVRYVTFWNSKPQNRLNKEKQLNLNMNLEDILRKGVEHDQLNVCMTNLRNLIKSFVYGTGCPQISMGLILQLQRKGTSMDHLSFRIDVNSLQPPLDINQQGQTKYTLVNITSQSSKNLYNIYSKLLELTHYTQHNNNSGKNTNNNILNNELNNVGNVNEVTDTNTYKMLLNIYGISLSNKNEEIVDFGDLRDNLGMMSFSEIGLLRKKMCLFQTFFDSVDMIGRDGNFVMGFGYIGNYPWTFCLGYGPLWDCVELLKSSCDINKIIDLLIDNGTNYCGTFIKSDYKLQYNLGQLPVATSGGIPYWKLILVQQSLIQNNQNKNEDTSMLCLSGGYAKKWMIYLVSDIVEDDGVRESVRLLGDLVPISYNVNPRAKRGRKKVALKGIAEDLENDLPSAGGNFTSNTVNNNYLGVYSECDKSLIEWMKHLYMSLHPELTQLDNRSIVAKICSKTRLPLLWIRVDSSFSLMARIRRCQSGSMWEQQLNSDNNIYALIEACQALGSFGKSEYVSDNPLVESACKRLDNMIKKHKSHPMIRARCVYSLVCLYNRDPKQHKYLFGVFTKYLSSFSNLATHPTETRFIMEFYKGLCLLRNELGFTPDFVVDVLSNTIENLTGINMLIQGSNLMEAASYLSLQPDLSYQNKQNLGNNKKNNVLNLWELLWHMFRLDGIPGSCSFERILTNKFLLCLSRQPVFLKLCIEKFKNDKDYGFDFDPLLFLPLKQNAKYKVQPAFELSQTYNSKLVQKAAIRLSFQLLLQSSYSFKLKAEGLEGFNKKINEMNNVGNVNGVNGNNNTISGSRNDTNNNNINGGKNTNNHLEIDPNKSEFNLDMGSQMSDKNENNTPNKVLNNKKVYKINEFDVFEQMLVNELFNEDGVVGSLEIVENGDRLKRLKRNEGIVESVKCACFLFYVVRNYELKGVLWDMLYRVVFDTCMSKPILFADVSLETLEKARKYMLVILKKASVSKLPFYLNLFPKVHKVYSLLFGFGTLLVSDPKPDQNLINQRLNRLTSGLSMPKIASFRRAYGEGESGSGVEWQNVALEAVRALKELPQAHWFLKDPEKSFRGYKTIVKTPIWLNKIEQRAMNKYYTIPMQFKVDMALLFKNAKIFNKVDTIPYQDVVLLEEQFDSLWPCIVKAFHKSAKLNSQQNN